MTTYVFSDAEHLIIFSLLFDLNFGNIYTCRKYMLVQPAQKPEDPDLIQPPPNQSKLSVNEKLTQKTGGQVAHLLQGLICATL